LARLDPGFSLLSFSLILVGIRKIKENVGATELFGLKGVAVYFSRQLRLGEVDEVFSSTSLQLCAKDGWRVSDSIRNVRSDSVANTDYASETATFQIALPTSSILEGVDLPLPRRFS
jgi:hypothetical protein